METSRWTKANVVIAGLGLLVTASIPWVTYHLIDPKFQELKHRPNLTAIESEVYYPNHRGSGVEITNEGLLPATGIMVTFRTLVPEASLPQKPDFEVTPPSPYTWHRTDSDVSVKLERPLGQGQTVLVIMSGITIPATVKKRAAIAFVYYDQGEVTTISRIPAVLPYEIKSDRAFDNPTMIRLEPAKSR